MRLLAFDYGATSGRGILADYDGNKLVFGEDYRFDNRPVFFGKSFYWDFPSLFHELKLGLQTLSRDKVPDCIGVDTWGVDYGLLDKTGQLLGMAYHYRDARTEGIMDEVFKVIPKDELYNRTGIQFLHFNTIFQLSAHVKERPWMLEQADKLLFIPDLINYYLTGKAATEFTISSTSQMMDPRTKDWAGDLLNRLNIPTDILGNIVEPGFILGDLSDEITSELNVSKIPVAVVAGHDTASAVVAVPATREDYAYLSCGTWSLVGVETKEPVISDLSYRLNFTNEGGVGGTFRVLKNVMGLWIQTECLRSWAKEGFKVNYDELEKMIMKADRFICFIDPDDERFGKPGKMPQKVMDYCRETGQYVPETKAEILNCVKESLSLKYRFVLDSIEKMTGNPIRVLNLVGGGVRSISTCEFTANAIGRPVVAGPSEGTAVGNLMCQLIAKGEVKDLFEAREVLRNSVETVEYIPKDHESWNNAYGEFLKVTGLDKLINE